MTNKERAEIAANLKAQGKCNCCQAVLSVYKDRIPLDENILQQTGAGFAAGMGCMESTCGALIGSVIVAGFLTEGRGTVGSAKTILEEFKEKSGALVCRELKGIDTGKVLCECPDCVRHAVEALEKFE